MPIKRRKRYGQDDTVIPTWILIMKISPETYISDMFDMMATVQGPLAVASGLITCLV